MNYRIHTPQIDGNWLYREEGENRFFSQKVILPAGVDEWQECSNAEKLAWEEAHKPQEIPDAAIEAERNAEAVPNQAAE